MRETGLIRRDTTKVNGTALSEEFLNDFFSRKQGEATGAHVLENGDFVIGSVSSVRRVKPDLKAAAGKEDAVRDKLAQDYRSEIYQEYMQYLREKYNVAIYPENMPKAGDAGGE